MTFAKTIACALARPSARARRALLGLLALVLLACLSPAPSFARSSGCSAVACGQALAVSLSGEAAGEEGEEGEGEEAGEESGEQESEASAEGEGEETASAEAEAEEEAEARHRGHTRHGARSAIVLSNLHLTHKSLVGLKHNPLASRVEFSFSLAKSMKVRVMFLKQGKPHARKRWTAISADSLSLSATKGSSRHRLLGRNRLAAGRYRLTLWPARGRARSIYVSVRS